MALSSSPGTTLEAWRQYASSGRIAASLLRPPVYESWVRAHDAGARPDQFEAQTLGPGDTERLLEHENELITAARPYLNALSRVAGKERHAAMLGNRAAVVLEVVGDERTIHGPEPFPGPGSLLSEGVSGSNGIGTPLAQGGYSQLVGPEHFIGGFHPFTCQGIPIHDGGKTVGVLSTSLRRVAASRRLHDILICAAHGIGAELLYRHLQRSLQRVLDAQPGDARVLESLRQDVVQSHAAARLKVQAAARFLLSDRQPDARQVLRSAQEAIAEFRSQAGLWQELASGEKGIVQPVALLEPLRGLLELLRTELKIRRVEVVMDKVEWVTVHADRRRVLRELLQGLLGACSAAGPGGAVLIEVSRLPTNGQVRFIPHPAPGRSQGVPVPGSYQLIYPCPPGGAQQ